MNTNENVIIHNLITIGAVNMITSDGSTIPSHDNLAVKGHPYWSQLTVFYSIQNTPDPCKGSSGNPTWHGPVPDGEYFPPRTEKGQEGPEAALTRYITLVNGCPHNFAVTSTHEYQMTDFDFYNVQSGAARQNKISYQEDGVKNFVDDKGEAYYTIEGIDSTFQLWARTNKGDQKFPMRTDYHFDSFSTDDVAKGSTTELRDRGGYRAYNLVITGSEKYGHYWTSLRPPVAWMHAILNVIGDRKLRHVCMIGSHDAGMSRINGGTVGKETPVLD